MKKISKRELRKNTRIHAIEPGTIPEKISNKFLNEANTVVNELIEKIISLSISTNFNNKIEKSIPSTCFDFLKNTVDSYLSLNFISYDKEEINTNNSSFFEKNKQEIIDNIEPIINENEINNNLSISEPSFEEKIYFNNCLHGENNWDLMDEPLSNKYDRYATTLVKFKEIEKEKNRFNKNDKEILEEIDEENENNSLNENNNKKEENKELLEKYVSAVRKRTTKILSNIFNYDINNNNNRNKKKNMNDIMSQFSYHDLEDDNDRYKEPTNINYEKLRKEMQQKQNEENEGKKNQTNTRKEIENKMKLAVEKNRQYAGKKITVDSNGEIVFIKGIKLEKLSKEFLLMKTNTKLIKDEEKEKGKENEKNKSKKKKKKLDNNFGFDVINNNEDDKKKEKEKNVEKNDNPIDKNNEVIGEKSIKGRNQKLPKIKGGKSRPKENLDEIYKLKILKRIEEGPIILSGSNFDIMNMEVGVSIKEKEKYKTGGKDFYHKFNKYSMDNYNKQLKDTLQINSFYKSQVDNENYTKSDFNNYLGNLTEGYNSSINFANNNSNLNQQTVNSNKNFLTNYNTLSNFENSSMIKSKKINASLSPELKLSGTGMSLKGSIDKLNLISERQEKLAQKAQNIFKKKVFNYTSNKFKLPKLEEINKFSSEILTSSNWMLKKGVNNMIGKPSRKPEKPDFQEIKREMGINGKIFRDRSKNISRTRNNTDEKV